jgi:hypothetical protein
MMEKAERTVHEDCLGDVICVVARDDVVNAKHRRSAIKGLPSENTTECAVVLSANLRNDGVHSPSVQLIVGKDLQWHVVLLLIPLDRLEYG